MPGTGKFGLGNRMLQRATSRNEYPRKKIFNYREFRTLVSLSIPSVLILHLHLFGYTGRRMR
ncbi:hypothetical protein M426DRAFT_134701 [Hypoxylon sp. CI-4A]|nr:hypothetical protein M426DRAFT_134701 [Hypoxylon sp. CI-4A]